MKKRTVITSEKREVWVIRRAEEARPAPAARQGRFLTDEKAKQVGAGDAVRRGGPIAPTVGRLDGGTEFGTSHRGFILMDPFEIIEEFQEQHPGQHRQAIEVSIESIVFAHDIARRLDQAAETLGCSEGLGGFF